MNNNSTTNDRNDLQNETYQQDISYAANDPSNVTGRESSRNRSHSETLPSHTTETVHRYSHAFPLIKEYPDEILHQTIFVDKVIEVPQTITVLKPVYKKEIRELIREVPKIIERTIDRVVEVPDTKNIYPYFNNALQSCKTPVSVKKGTDASSNIPSGNNMCTCNTSPEESNAGMHPQCYATFPSQPLMNEPNTTCSLPIAYGSSKLESPSSAYQPPVCYTYASPQHTPNLPKPIYPECIPVTNMVPECSGTSTVLPYYTPTFPSASSYPTVVYPGTQPPMMAMTPCQPCTLIKPPTLAVPTRIQQPVIPCPGFPFSSSIQLRNDTSGAKLYKPKKPSMCCFTKPFLERQNLRKRNTDSQFFILKSSPFNTSFQMNRQTNNTYPRTMTYAYPYSLQGTTIYSSPVTAPFPFPM